MPQRNPYACHPLLRKGGAHIESKSARRSRDRQSLLDDVYECLEEREFDIEKQRRKEKDSPSCFFMSLIISGLDVCSQKAGEKYYEQDINEIDTFVFVDVLFVKRPVC